jgi:septum site-determining protein MinD
MGRVIAIISGKGGVGKTVTSINLAASLNKINKNVILVDGNFTTPNVALSLGSPVVPITLNHVLAGRRKIHEAIYQHHSGTKIVPSSISLKSLKNTNLENFPKALKDLKKLAEIVIIDSAAGLGKEALASLENADDIIIVTNPEMPAVTDALKTIKLAEQLKKNVAGVILTRTRNDNKEMQIKNIMNLLEKPIIGIVPEDDYVRESIMIRDAVVHTRPKSKASRAYKKIAYKLVGEELEEERGFFSRLFGLGRR